MWFEKSRTSGGVVFELFACATKGRRPKAACRFSAKQPLGVMPYSTPHLLTTPYRVNFLISVTLIQISTPEEPGDDRNSRRDLADLSCSGGVALTACRLVDQLWSPFGRQRAAQRVVRILASDALLP